MPKKANKIGGWKKTLTKAAGTRPSFSQSNIPAGTYRVERGRLVPVQPTRSGQAAMRNVRAEGGSELHPNDLVTQRVGIGAALAGAAAVGGASAYGLSSALLQGSRTGSSPTVGGPDSTSGSLSTTGPRIVNRFVKRVNIPDSSHPVQNNEVRYTAPVIVGVESRGSRPKMWAAAKNGDVSVTVEHVEYLRDIIANGSALWTPGANVWQLPVNPGNKVVFSWLSDLAQLFDEYEFEKLEFSYNPAVGSNTAGKLLLTFDPDVVDEMPDNKQDMLQARAQLDATPWHEARLPVPKDMLVGRRFNRTFMVPVGTDPHVYDVGALNIAVPGAPAGMVGELFVKYKVKFTSPNGGQAQCGRSGYNTTTAPASPLGTAGPGGVVGAVYPIWLSATTFKIPVVACLKIDLVLVGTTFAGDVSLGVSGTSVITLLYYGSSTTRSNSSYAVTLNDPDAIFTVTSPAGAATVTNTRIFVTEWDTDSN